MNIYITTVTAVCPVDGSLKKYAGPSIPSISFSEAQNYCNNNGLSYCKVEGLLMAEWSNEGGLVDYDNERNN